METPTVLELLYFRLFGRKIKYSPTKQSDRVLYNITLTVLILLLIAIWTSIFIMFTYIFGIFTLWLLKRTDRYDINTIGLASLPLWIIFNPSDIAKFAKEAYIDMLNETRLAYKMSI
jgi:hypothetical protein